MRMTANSTKPVILIAHRYDSQERTMYVLLSHFKQSQLF